MKTGIAAWHYPHRTMAQNIRYFSQQGFLSISLHGGQFAGVLANEEQRDEVTRALYDTGIELTIHHSLPRTLEEKDEQAFFDSIRRISRFQAEHGLISVLSFDVQKATREKSGAYADFILSEVANTRIAYEDYGINEIDYEPIKRLQSNPLFGHLVDIGHLYIRLANGLISDETSPVLGKKEGVKCEHPTAYDIAVVLKNKPLPIFELHIHNNDGKNDTHRFLSDGTLDIYAVAQALHDIEYKGIATIESAPGFRFDCHGDDADRGILETRDFWQQFLDKAKQRIR